MRACTREIPNGADKAIMPAWVAIQDTRRIRFIQKPNCLPYPLADSAKAHWRDLDWMTFTAKDKRHFQVENFSK